MVAYGAEQRVRIPALRAGWVRQTFVHWPYPPQAVQALLPRNLAVDAYEGAAWVSLTPFVMAGVRPPGVPGSLPGLPTFAETNLRTYVRDRDGRDGLWFLTIEVACPLMLAAWAVGVPYHQGTLRVAAHGDVVSYTGTRWGGGVSYRLTVRPGAPLRPTERDVWLTSRWRAYSRRYGLLWRTPVEHEPWPLRAAVVEEAEQTLTGAAGLPPPAGEPVVHFSDGVRHVRLGPPRPWTPDGSGPPEAHRSGAPGSRPSGPPGAGSGAGA
ncbi:YqjF family protein [Streptomyces sp. NPDC014802]|uniref:YqjF family protein n=1 Tax=unclassified Streptomyces TaxID=2593676 RepID=UPI0036FFE734